MAVSENFTGKNYWGLVQQRGPWKMTGRDYANQMNAPIDPGPAGQRRFNGKSTTSFKDNFSVMPGAPDVSTSRYTQYSIVSGRGRSYVPAPNPTMPGGNLGWQSNQQPGDMDHDDPASKLNMDANAFGVSLGDTMADKPLYAKPGAFITQQYLIEQALDQQARAPVQMADYERNAMAEDFYDHVIGGVAPMTGAVSQKVSRAGPNLVQTFTTDAFGAPVYNEHFTPTRRDMAEGMFHVHKALQARVDESIDAYNYVSESNEYAATRVVGRDEIADPFTYK